MKINLKDIQIFVEHVDTQIVYSVSEIHWSDDTVDCVDDDGLAYAFAFDKVKVICLSMGGIE
jgi:hypothetical protein